MTPIRIGNIEKPKGVLLLALNLSGNALEIEFEIGKNHRTDKRRSAQGTRKRI